MKTRMLVVFLALALLIPMATRKGLAEVAKTPQDAMTQVTKQLQALQRQVEEMKRQHAKEINDLKVQIEGLRKGTVASTAAGGDEASQLRQLAEAEAGKGAGGAGEVSEETVYRAKGLSLQTLNPEISITGDMFALYRDQPGNRDHSDFTFRNLGLHVESYLDPYTRFKSAIEFHPGEEGAELGEVYMIRYGLLEGLNATFGKFRQQFGVINRWHKHGLDQLDFPLPLRMIFGEGGLNQTGVSFDWTMPKLWDASQELTVQVTNGENGRLFTGNALSIPSVLLHYKNYRDLSKDTYLELGLTGLFGWNDEWSVQSGGATTTVHDSLSARVFSADLNVLWEPTDRMRYRNVEWRSELYLLNRDLQAPDGSGRDTVNAWGGTSYLQTKLNRTLTTGVRFDYFEPDQKAYAGIGDSMAPHAFTDDVHRWQVGPYLTWQQSPFVKYRIEFDHVDGRGIEEDEDLLFFQIIFAAGPHKHERY